MMKPPWAELGSNRSLDTFIIYCFLVLKMKKENKPHEVKYSKMVKDAIEAGRVLLKKKTKETDIDENGY